MGYPVRPLDMLALWRIFPGIRGYLLATDGSLTATRYSPAYVGGYPYEIDDDTPDFQNFPCIRGYPTDECSFSLNGILSPAYGGIRHIWGLPHTQDLPRHAGVSCA